MSKTISTLADNQLIEMQEFSPKKADYCVISGVLNEGERITMQVGRMQDYRNVADIIIVDGGSTDGATSPEVMKDKITTLIIDKRKRGLSGQYQSAIAYAYDAGYKGMIMIDGNGKDGVDGIPNFIAAMEDGADFVQGSRFLPGGEHLNTPSIRYLGIKFVFCPIITAFSGFRYTDAINGFKSVSRKLIEHPEMQIFRDEFPSYSLQYYMNFRAPKIGLDTREVPVRRNYPKGAVPTKIHGLKAYFNILDLLLKACVGKYNPKR